MNSTMQHSDAPAAQQELSHYVRANDSRSADDQASHTLQTMLPERFVKTRTSK
jgi:hypothetical protein